MYMYIHVYRNKIYARLYQTHLSDSCIPAFVTMAANKLTPVNWEMSCCKTDILCTPENIMKCHSHIHTF